jgi:hypothetical protein
MKTFNVPQFYNGICYYFKSTCFNFDKVIKLFTLSYLQPTWHDAKYSFLNGYYGYHQISIALKDKYKTTFVTNWGAFTWVLMPFGIKNGPPTY